MAVRAIRNFGPEVSTKESDWVPLPEPAGAVYAESRGQSREQYNECFYRGKWGERLACIALRQMGFMVTDPDDSLGMNPHAPDLTLLPIHGNPEYLHVKTLSDKGWDSWVVEGTAIRRLPENHFWVLTTHPKKNEDTWSARIEFVAPWEVGISILRPLRCDHLPTKRAIYRHLLMPFAAKT